MSVPEPTPDREQSTAGTPAGPPAFEKPPLPEQPPAPEQSPDVEQSLDVEPPVADQPPAGARKLPRAAGVALAVAGLLAVTATSAAVTVAVGKPDHPGHAVAGAAPSATASAAPSAAPSASASPSPTPPPSAVTPVPRPASTLQGSVSGDRHSGDLRYFLLPVPDTADPYGSSDGAMLTVEEMQKSYGDDVDLKGILDSWGFKDAATRTYRTRDGKMEVDVELRRFNRADDARGFGKATTYKLEPFDVDGVPGARGYLDKPEQQAFTGRLHGIGVVGDVVYEVHVRVQGDPDKALLADAMKRQRDRLANG
ncbi:hypothetical protein [Kitasatospora sp. NPDC088134]|uniref:hypothetical protein n=1 Tax=Kitasatospora sp. NPDC088134 TaxID=3364071 RepID=UPI00382493F0